MQLVARGMVRGQGKTAGYHERIIPLRSKTRQALQHPSSTKGLGGIAHQRLEQIGIVQGILSQAIQVFAAGGGRDRDSTGNEQVRRAVARPWLNQLDESVDGHFFNDLQTEWEAEAKDERARIRNEWLQEVVLAPARRLLQWAGESLPYSTIYRYRARAQAEGLFEGRLRGTGGLPFLFDTQAENSHMSTSLSPDPAAARETEGQSRTWGDIAYRFTCAVAEMAAEDRGTRRIAEDESARPRPRPRSLLAADGRGGVAGQSRTGAPVGADSAWHRSNDGRSWRVYLVRPRRRYAGRSGPVCRRRTASVKSMLQRGPAGPPVDGARGYVPRPAAVDVQDDVRRPRVFQLAGNGQVNCERGV